MSIKWLELFLVLLTIWSLLDCKQCISSEKEENGNKNFSYYDSIVLMTLNDLKF